MSDPKDLVRRLIVRLRNDTGMSIDEFAKSIEVPRSQIYRWESGDVQPSAFVLFKISQVFNYRIIVDAGTIKKLRPLTSMQNSEFHRFFKATNPEGFTPEEVKWMIAKMTDRKALYSMLFNFGRDYAYENMENEMFDLTFRIRKKNELQSS